MSQSDPVASRETLTVFRLSRASEEPAAGSEAVKFQKGGRVVEYHRVFMGPKYGQSTTFARFPIVLNADGSPWAEACLYLVDRAKLKPHSIDTLHKIAVDLVYYKRFLDEFGIEYDNFNSAETFALPTYEYAAYLRDEIRLKRVGAGAASKRMSSVLGFYRHLMAQEKFQFSPAFSPWQESRVNILFKDEKGFSQAKEVVVADISIQRPKTGTVWDMTIQDGGRLRPLPLIEQKAVLAALRKLKNTEYTLMHEISLLTAARIQTVLTLRLGNFLAVPDEVLGETYKLRCGPGTGIDTKGSRSGVYLTIPKQLYERLHIYALSDRAKKRRERSALRESPQNYLFLTQHGKPFYESADDRNAIRGHDEPMKYARTAQHVRKFIDERIIPLVRAEIPDFRYSFHDLRATFGMNYVDYWVDAISQNAAKYSFVLNNLRELMWHRSLTDTERYLQYREHFHMTEAAQEGWNMWLEELNKG